MDQQQKTPSSIYFKDGRYYIIVNAKPNSKRSQLTALTDDAADINIAAPPRDGEANEELCEFISDALNIKKSAVQVQRGGKGRNKLIQIEAKFKDLNEFYNILKSNIQ